MIFAQAPRAKRPSPLLTSEAAGFRLQWQPPAIYGRRNRLVRFTRCNERAVRCRGVLAL
jgi:hypothetical protein